MNLEERYGYLRNLFPGKDSYYLRRMCVAYCTTEEGLTEFVENGFSGVFPADTAGGDAVDVLDPALEAQREFFCSLLPDADPVFMKKKFKELAGKPNDIDVFVEECVITSHYPKKVGNCTPSTSRGAVKEVAFDVEKFLMAIPDPYDHFAKKNPKSNQYKQEALKYLKVKLRRSCESDLSEALENHNWCLFSAFKDLQETGDVSDERNLSDFGDCIALKQEIAFIENEIKIKEFIEKDKKIKEEEFMLAEANGMLLDCETCFSPQPPSVLKTCAEGHMFCVPCLKTGFAVLFSEGAVKYPCYSPDCKALFSEDVLKSIMTPIAFSNHLRRLQSKDIEDAKIENLETCAFCNSYVAITGPDDKVFKCLNPECMMESCLKCHHKAHIPFACHEKEQKEVKMRIFIESKMTEALVRSCWSCKASFIKEEGTCNRIRCRACQALTCYVCKQQVDDSYKHFYGQGTSPADIDGRCPLWSDINELHVKAVEEEGMKAREMVLLENPGIELVNDPTKILPEEETVTHLPGI